jgi:carboxymethylenebutenolidase
MEREQQHAEVQVADASMPMYIAHPPGDEPRPTIIVIHEIYGLVPHTEDVVRRFAAEGFVAAAPNLFFQTEIPDFSDRSSFMTFRQNLDDAEMLRNVDAAVVYLREQPYVDGDHIGIIGYCFGGYTALLATAHNPAIAALADYYGAGAPEVILQAARKIDVPVLGMFGAADQSIPSGRVKDLDRVLQESGADTEFHVYQGAGHAFFNDTRPATYNRAAAEDAWPRTVAFFKHALQGPA